MEQPLAALFVLSVQAALATLLGSIVAWSRLYSKPSRRGLATWSRSARGLVRVLPYAALCAAVWYLALSVNQATLLPLDAMRRVWVRPWIYVISGSLPCWGLWTLILAGRLERNGKLREARRQARLGGGLAFFFTLLHLVSLWTELILFDRIDGKVLQQFPWAGVWFAAANVTLGVSAWVALLGGLSGKPRQATGVAVILFLFGFGCILASTHQVPLP